MAYIIPSPLALSVNLLQTRSAYLLPADSKIYFLLGGKIRPPEPPNVISSAHGKWEMGRM